MDTFTLEKYGKYLKKHFLNYVLIVLSYQFGRYLGYLLNFSEQTLLNTEYILIFSIAYIFINPCLQIYLDSKKY
jgi:hypothetical protein